MLARLLLLVLVLALSSPVQRSSCQASTISVSTSSIEALPEEVSVGSRQHFIIVARYHSGDQVLRGGSIWSVRFVGPVYVSPVCISDQGNGTYKVTYVLPQPGEYSLQVELKYQDIHTSRNTSCARNRTMVFNMYTACNPKSDYYVSLDGLKGCSHNLASEQCIDSMQSYITCMDRIKDVCQYPHLIKERFSQARLIRAVGGGVVSPHSSRACSTRAEVLGPGHWVNVSHTCSIGMNWYSLGFSSEQACRDAIYPCSTIKTARTRPRDDLSTAICGTELIWRPNTCHLSPVPKHALRHRHFFFYGVSTIEEIARRMRDYYPPEHIICLRQLRKSAEIPWRQPNTTFVLHACGEQVATTLSLTLHDRARQRSCHRFTQMLHRLMTEPTPPLLQHSSPSSSIDIIYQRHPVNYPRNARTPTEIKNAIGRYPGSRGYMSTDELLTDFYYDIMAIYTREQAPISGILNQQEMTEALWGEYGDGLHYDNDALRFVLDQCVLLLANAAVLSSGRVTGPPLVHDPLLGTCPSYFKTQGLYYTDNFTHIPTGDAD